MLKLNVTSVDEPTAIDFSATVSNPTSLDNNDVLADLENLWGENRDCFDSLLNADNKSSSDSDSCDDFSNSDIPRFSTKPLVSKLAPIGETFGQNATFESCVSSALSMVNSSEEGSLSSSPHHEIMGLPSDFVMPEFSEAQSRTSARDKASNLLQNRQSEFATDNAMPSVKQVIALSNSSKTSRNETIFLQKSNRNNNMNHNLGCENKNHALISSFLEANQEQERFEQKKQQLMIRGIVTPPVSPEEESCNPLSFPVTSACTQSFHQIHVGPNVYNQPLSMTPKTTYQRTDITGSLHLGPFPYSMPSQQAPEFHSYNTNCGFDRLKVKTEPGSWLDLNSGNIENPHPKVSRTHFTNTNSLQETYSVPQQLPHNPWILEEKSFSRESQGFNNTKQETAFFQQQVR